MEGNFGIWSQDRTWVNLYKRCSFRQGVTTQSLNSNLAVRIQNEDNLLVSFGIDDWDVLSGNGPNIFKGWAIYGMFVNGWRPFVGANIGYNANTSRLHYHKYLIGLKQADWSMIVHTDFNKKHIAIPTTSDNSYKNETTIICDGRVDKDVRLSSELKFDKNPLMKEPDVRFNGA